MYIEEVDKDKQIAYVLSHNALVGKDDAQMLKEIYSEMRTIEAREFLALTVFNLLIQIRFLPFLLMMGI